MHSVVFVGPPPGAEFVLLVWIVVPIVLAYWVFRDAQSRGNTQAPWWALAVGGLGYLTFFGGFLALAIYVWQRGKELDVASPS